MGTPDGTAGTVTDVHSVHHADCALDRHCRVPLQVGLPPPIQHQHTQTEQKDVRVTHHTQEVQMSGENAFPG